jgi:hypothetical protein
MNIRSIIRRLSGHPFLGQMFFLGLVFFVLPFVVYAVERLTGIMPSAMEWQQKGYNHGPWHVSPQGLLVLYPYFLLIPSMLVCSVVLAVAKRSPALLLRGLGLCGLFVLMAGLQIYYFWFVEGWIVD